MEGLDDGADTSEERGEEGYGHVLGEGGEEGEEGDDGCDRVDCQSPCPA